MSESSVVESFKAIETEVWKKVGVGKTVAEREYRSAKDIPLPEVIVTEIEQTASINGFLVPAPSVKHEDTTARDSAFRSLEKFRSRLTGFESLLEEREKLTKALRKAGIEPIAVLPRGQWNALCKKFDLIRFENLSGSTTGVPSLISLGTCLWIYFGAIISTLLFSFLSNGRDAIGIGDVALAVVQSCILGWLALFPLMGVGAALKAISDHSNMITFLVKVLPRRFVARVLFLRGYDCSPHGNDKAFAIDMNFPLAPQEVIDTVYKARGVFLHDCYCYIGVAADPGAVSIDAEKTVSTWARERRVRQADPIVYAWSWKKPLVVAIVAQYGDFLSEKKCIKAVRSLGDEAFLA